MISKLIGSLVEKACYALAKKFPSRIITRGDAEPYLVRHYILRRSWLAAQFSWFPSVYLHHFLRGDDEEELHNHPWGTSVSFILAGGYREERRDGNAVRTRIVRPGMVNIIRGDDFHKVELLDPVKGAWTIFISGTRAQDWGFWHPETSEYLSWREHVARRKVKQTLDNTLERANVLLFGNRTRVAKS
jgi:hypothetical protein